jgi:hypothetical protein
MELVKTIVHEWTHSTQRILTEYQKLHRKFGYRDNPLEIEAYAAEKIWGRKALNYVKKNWKKPKTEQLDQVTLSELKIANRADAN